MDGEHEKDQRYLHWNIITKHQSFTTRITEDGQTVRVRETSSCSSKSISPAASSPDSSNESDESASEHGSPQSTGSAHSLGSSDTSMDLNRDDQIGAWAHERGALDVPLQPTPSKWRRIDDEVTQETGSPKEAIVAREHVEAHYVERLPRATVSDEVVYEQNKAAIEAEWAKKPLARKKAPVWEKVAHWRSKHTLKDQNRSSTTAQTAPMAQQRQKSTSSLIEGQTPPIADPTIAVGQQDWEDANEPSTWHKFQGQQDRYRCGHQAYDCIDGSCRTANHDCCRNGL